MSLGNQLILGSKGQGHESQKHCRRGSLYDTIRYGIFTCVQELTGGS